MVTKNDILAIRGGQTMKFAMSGIKECNSARVTASWVGKNICPADVACYTTKTRPKPPCGLPQSRKIRKGQTMDKRVMRMIYGKESKENIKDIVFGIAYTVSIIASIYIWLILAWSMQ